MTQWTPQQLKCLEAIGVPVYAHVPSDRQAASSRDEDPAKAKIAQPHKHKDSPEAKVIPVHGNSEGAAKTEVTQPTSQQDDAAEAQTQSNKPTAPYYYQLGPWIFEFEHTLPVESFDWLRDLAAYCKSTPAQVSQADKPVKLDNYARNKLSPAAKKELWQLLKAAR